MILCYWARLPRRAASPLHPLSTLAHSLRRPRILLQARFWLAGAVIATAVPFAVADANRTDYDVVIYGGSSAGVIAAVQAAHMGKSTVLISAHRHVGGVTASGLGTTDTGNVGTIGGLTRQFYANIYRYYHVAAETTGASRTMTDAAKYDFEPHAAEAVFTDMLRQSGADWILGEQLDRVGGVTRRGRQIVSIRMKSGREFTGRMFIDATYEGDLMAAAGVRYRVGRESSAEYHESIAGVYRDQELVAEVDPYRVPGDPSSGLLPGVSPVDPGPNGTGDNRVQQYNLRLCVTNVLSNRIPFTPPLTYDRANYELLARRLLSRPTMPITEVIKIQPLPNGKADINANGSFSTDMAGDDSTHWPEASDEERATILQRYRDYTQGMFWFLIHDPAVPASIRLAASQWGLAADEFLDTDHWPWQLYVREARRMIGSYLLTQWDCDGVVRAPDPVALGSYPIDSHKVTLFIDANGQLNTEGFMFYGVDPWAISYRSLIPRAEECVNLLVPICISATHAAYNSMRMEPVYMMLGQSAGTAASLAIDQGTTVQNLPYSVLAAQLLADGQILSWNHTALDAELDDQPDDPSDLRKAPATKFSTPQQQQ
jgi:hypothetical protein